MNSDRNLLGDGATPLRAAPAAAAAYLEGDANRAAWVLERRLERERRSRIEAERLLEEKARALYEANLDLSQMAAMLEARVADLEAERKRIERLALTDPLTGAFNRTAFATALEAAIARGASASAPLALFSIDLDGFKAINDVHGHAAGDAVLTTVVRRLSALVGPEGVVARTGGDEFLVLDTAPGGPRAALAQAKAMADALGDPLRAEGLALQPAGSVGLALFPLDAADAEELLRNSDMALYRAKLRGGGGAVRYDKSLYETIVVRRELTRRLEVAIASGEIEPWFQPIVDPAHRERRRVEVLARWRHAEKGLVSPGVFVPLAEEGGLIAALDAAVLRAASGPLVDWFERGVLVSASCNVSMIEFRERRFAERFIEQTADLGLAPKHLIVEITETSVGEDPKRARAHILRLSEAGFKIALDDFGTGYSNLRALRDLPIDVLKLDRSLIMDVADDPRMALMLDAVVRIARAVGARIVAEGVETAEQAGAARAAGCEFQQGFLYARPMPAAEFDAWVDL